MRCEVCGSKSSVEEEIISPEVKLMTCRRCRAASHVANTADEYTRAAKKVPVDMFERHPPSREWLEHQELRRVWDRLHELKATTSQSKSVDDEIQRRFGGLQNDPYLGLYRLESGEVLIADGIEIEVEL